MEYRAIVRLKKGNAVTYKMEHYSIRDAAKEVRGKHGLGGENPHRGFVIKEGWYPW